MRKRRCHKATPLLPFSRNHLKCLLAQNKQRSLAISVPFACGKRGARACECRNTEKNRACAAGCGSAGGGAVGGWPRGDCRRSGRLRGRIGRLRGRLRRLRGRLRRLHGRLRRLHGCLRRGRLLAQKMSGILNEIAVFIRNIDDRHAERHRGDEGDRIICEREAAAHRLGVLGVGDGVDAGALIEFIMPEALGRKVVALAAVAGIEGFSTVSMMMYAGIFIIASAG